MSFLKSWKPLAETLTVNNIFIGNLIIKGLKGRIKYQYYRDIEPLPLFKNWSGFYGKATDPSASSTFLQYFSNPHVASTGVLPRTFSLWHLVPRVLPFASHGFHRVQRPKQTLGLTQPLGTSRRTEKLEGTGRMYNLLGWLHWHSSCGRFKFPICCVLRILIWQFPCVYLWSHLDLGMSDIYPRVIT